MNYLFSTGKVFFLFFPFQVTIIYLFNFIVWDHWDSHADIQKQFRKILYIHHPASPNVSILDNNSLTTELENGHWIQSTELIKISPVYTHSFGSVSVCYVCGVCLLNSMQFCYVCTFMWLPQVRIWNSCITTKIPYIATHTSLPLTLTVVCNS